MLRFVAVALFLVLTFALPFLLWGERFEALISSGDTVQWLRDLGPYAWLSATLVLLADIVLPIPSTAVMAALGIIYGPVVGGLISTVASVLSGVLAYGLCRHFGRPLTVWFVGPRMFDFGQSLFDKSGVWIIALSRWQPILPEVLACLAGLSRMRFDMFLLALVCGSAPLGFVFAKIGHSGQQWPITTLVLTALAPFLLLLLMRPILRRTTESRSV